MSKKTDSKKKGVQSTMSADGRLRIDCSGCKGESSVSNRECVLCMCKNIIDHGTVTSISLNSAVDVALMGDAISSIRELAFIYRMMTENRSERRGKKCARCKNSFSSLVKDQIASFPEINIPALRDRMSQMQFTDPVCTLCAGDSLRLIGTLEDTLEGICVCNSPLEQGVN